MASIRKRKNWIDRTSGKRFYSAKSAQAWETKHPEARIESHVIGWQARVQHGGRQPVTKCFRTREQAQRWAYNVEDRLFRGEGCRQPGAELRALREALEWYRDHISCHRQGAETEAYRLRRLIAELGDLRIIDLDAPAVIAYVRRRLDKVCGDTIRRELGLLSDAVTTIQVEWDFTLPVNPVMAARPLLRKMRAMAGHGERTRRLQPGELEALLAAPHTQRTLIGAVIEFAIETAMRRAEIAALRREDINWGASTLTIRQSKTDWKTGARGRVIPLSPRALEILRGVPVRIDGSVFGLGDPHSITRAFQRTIGIVNRLAEAGRKGFVPIEDLRFHDLRHEAASRLFERGLGIEEVATVTGHRDWKSLKRYTHLDPEKLAQRLKQVA